jgi:hypothetical protein
LVDRGGRVANVNLRGDALLERIKELLGVSDEPPARTPAPIH